MKLSKESKLAGAINTEVEHNTVGTRFNDLEGTEDFWPLNPNFDKSNFQFSSINLNRFITRQLRLASVSNQLLKSFFKPLCKWPTDIQTDKAADNQKDRKTDGWKKTYKCSLIKTHNVM